MSLEIMSLIAGALYKICSLLVGLVICYLGYKLFLAGVWGNAGDLSAKFNNNKVVLKSAAPGTFFVLFGSIVISLTIWQGFTVKSKRTESLERPTVRTKPAKPAVPATVPDFTSSESRK